MKADIDQTLQKLTRATKIESLWRLTVDALRAEGISMVSYHMVDARNATIRILSEGFPDDWVHEYVELNYLAIDPIPELASKLSEPFFWHDVDKLVQHTPQVDSYLEAMNNAGLGDGLAMYVFGPGLRNAYVGLGFGDRQDLPDRDEVMRYHFLVQAAHLRLCALTDPGERSPLSAREVEVLKWIALGKSNSVIADILEISTHTVDAHLRSIYRKLGVSDRTTAAIRGVGATLVSFPDPEGT